MIRCDKIESICLCIYIYITINYDMAWYESLTQESIWHAFPSRDNIDSCSIISFKAAKRRLATFFWECELVIAWGKTFTSMTKSMELLRLIVQVDLEGEINKATVFHLALEGSSLFVVSIVDLEV